MYFMSLLLFKSNLMLFVFVNNIRMLFFIQDRRVLVKIDENGCYPRYACAEMNKISTSVMKFRLGNRQLWPLPHSHDQKGVVCSEANFMLPIRPDDSRLYPSRQPILIIKESTVNTVRCGLPYSLDDGIVFMCVR